MLTPPRRSSPDDRRPATLSTSRRSSSSITPEQADQLRNASALLGGAPLAASATSLDFQELGSAMAALGYKVKSSELRKVLCDGGSAPGAAAPAEYGRVAPPADGGTAASHSGEVRRRTTNCGRCVGPGPAALAHTAARLAARAAVSCERAGRPAMACAAGAGRRL